jgi:hypothetical protein
MRDGRADSPQIRLKREILQAALFIDFISSESIWLPTSVVKVYNDNSYFSKIKIILLGSVSTQIII